MWGFAYMTWRNARRALQCVGKRWPAESVFSVEQYVSTHKGGVSAGLHSPDAESARSQTQMSVASVAETGWRNKGATSQQGDLYRLLELKIQTANLARLLLEA